MSKNTKQSSPKKLVVEIGIIRFKKAGIFRAFLPDSNVVIDVLNDTGFNRDFEVFFKKNKPLQFQWVIKVEANLLTLKNLSKLASKIRRFIGETIFNLANAGQKVKPDEMEVVEWDLNDGEGEEWMLYFWVTYYFS